ncbi:Phage terminase large subunit [Fodinibius roseus]|uniref:Phage terminase large subunit n=1 Tax=Fodinibius roseus TaxID=1194090 RepID=A0A1M5C7S0_9BACT|nr:phage terminase large subunit [Fodinibius roseus]SHF50789.1 Phage terminase large subunit [Fodinibius roseus]
MKEIKLHPKQDDAYELLTESRKRFVCFGGGSRGGKSWLGWVWLILSCMQHPNTRWFVGREELKRLRNTTLMTFFKVCGEYNIPTDVYSYNKQDHYIEFENGSRIDLLELKYKPSDPLFQRFGSSEYTGGWIEEAGEIEHDAFDILKTRVGQHRNQEYDLTPGKILITCNPEKNWLYFNFYLPWKKDNLHKDYAFIQSLYDDNPYREPGTDQQLGALINEAQKQRLKHGNWEYADDPDALLSHSDLLGTQEVEIQKGTAYCGADIARYGSDSTTFAKFNGNHLEKLKTFDNKDNAEVANRLLAFIATEAILPKNCGIDTVGLGAGVFDNMKEKGKTCTEVISGAKPTKQYDSFSFKNLRSQMWWQFREDVKNKKIVIDFNDEELRSDLTAPRYSIVGEKMIQVESKSDIKKRLGRSPDKGDAVVYANAMRAGIIKTKKILRVSMAG